MITHCGPVSRPPGLTPGSEAFAAELVQAGDRIDSMESLGQAVGGWREQPPPKPGYAWRTMWRCCNKPYNLVLDGGCSASTIPEEVLLRIGNDCLKLKAEDKQFGLTGLVKYSRGVDMSGLTGPALTLRNEAWVKWELPGADGRSAFVEVKHRVLPKGSSNPRNILISAGVLEEFYLD